ncbi:unnamed protein product [Auanema sp. JU1783]|nr:unnamed protein product [Auanema sp. JU1783]
MKGILNIVKEGNEDQTEKQQHPRRFSLVHQASCETQHIIGLKRRETIRHRQQLEKGLPDRKKEILQKLNDEAVELIWSAETGSIEFSAILSSSAPLSDFVRACLESFESNGIDLQHIESRKGKIVAGKTSWDLLADCNATKEQLLLSASALVHCHLELSNIALYHKKREPTIPWFPKHVSDLDLCSHCITKYEPTTDPRHPGHGDEAYIARRQFLNNQALEYKHGDPIPYVEYTKEEHETWKAVYEKLKTLHDSLACDTYRKNLNLLEEEGVLSSEEIPQIRDVNKFLRKRTGFILRPCSGLLSARDFLASLAFRVFQTTTYLRHSASPHHSPEPDLIHELLGHVPMFSDPLLAQMSQDIGLMSLGATDEQIEKLATVYWFIVEFGLCEEDGKLKAIGAGLLSAYGELMHACSDVPEQREFVPELTAIQKYEDSEYQPLYFKARSIQDALVKLRQYALSMNRPFSVIYNPITQNVEMVNRVSDLNAAFDRFRLEFSSISQSFDVINKKTN